MGKAREPDRSAGKASHAAVTRVRVQHYPRLSGAVARADILIIDTQ